MRHPRSDDATPASSVAFSDLGLSPALLRALQAQGYETPTPIQAQAIPHLLEGRDVLGVAQTGTGKTAAFALPMLDLLNDGKGAPNPRCPRALILTPTRELASQIADSFRLYGANTPIKGTVIFGGVGQNPQVQTMRRGVDVLVATPGRLLDLMGQRHIDLSEVEFFVLDEADRMLDMGFLRDVRRIVDALPGRRQSLLFSATMPNDIVKLAQKLLYKPVRVEVSPPASTLEKIKQSVWFVEKADKRKLLTDILEDKSIERVLVFSRTKHGANRVVRHLESHGVSSAALHGNKSQGARERALEGFRKGSIRALVATDIAARGLDVRGITHVINFDLPNISESYVHRIGRTARAGREGVAISFCDQEERAFLRDIERLIKLKLEFAGTIEPSATRAAGGEASVRGRGPAGQSSGRQYRSRRSSGGGRSGGGRSSGGQAGGGGRRRRR